MSVHQTDTNIRLAIIDTDRCKVKKCQRECKKFCPVERTGKQCVEIENVASISEVLCIGCGICTKKCPFDAIKIIQLPHALDSETSHRYGANSFKLHRLPLPRLNNILGIVGANGTGKSTLLKILSNKIVPNLGRLYDSPTTEEIITHYRGSSLQNFFQGLYNGDIVPVLKPQYVDAIPMIIKRKMTVSQLLESRDQRGIRNNLKDELEIGYIWDRDIHVLSGGELQRVAIAATIVRDARIYLFDEPSSFLDVRQRVMIAKVIRKWCCTPTTYTIVVEHDLSLLDYLSDFICFTYGQPAGYGVVSVPFSVGEGINVFLDGYNPKENMRFRPFSLDFKLKFEVEEEEIKYSFVNEYPNLEKKMEQFHLSVDSGSFNRPEIIVLLGQNGAGKTTFLRMVAGLIQSDNDEKVPELGISYKPQKIFPKFKGTVRQLFHEKIPNSFTHNTFISEVIKPLDIEHLYDKVVRELSGGELQRVAIVLALGKPADIYLIDEPSAYLDSEQRLAVSKVIKRFIFNFHRTAFIVEHDIMMVNYLADRIVVFETDNNTSIAHTPVLVKDGMNTFLSSLDVTIRKDLDNFRPRINKYGSVKDNEQRKNREFYQ